MKVSHTSPPGPGNPGPAGPPHAVQDNFGGAWLVYTGLFLITVVAIVAIHEFGHYLAFRLQGYDDVTVRISPFMGVTSTTEQVHPKDAAWIVLGGTILNLSVAAIAALGASKVGGIPRRLLQVYSAHAFLIEGTVILAGFFVEETVTDFSMLIVLGMHPALVGCIGLGFGAVAGLLLLRLWREFGGSTRIQYAFLSLPVIVYMLAGAAASLAIQPIPPSFIRKFMLIGFILLTAYLAALTTVFPLVLRRLNVNLEENRPRFSIRAGIFWLISGTAVWALSLI